MSPKSKVITNDIRAKCARSTSCVLFVSQFAHYNGNSWKTDFKRRKWCSTRPTPYNTLMQKKKNQRERKVPFHDDSVEKLNKMFVRIPAGRWQSSWRNFLRQDSEKSFSQSDMLLVCWVHGWSCEEWGSSPSLSGILWKIRGTESVKQRWGEVSRSVNVFTADLLISIILQTGAENNNAKIYV